MLTPDLGLPTSRTRENKFQLLTSHPAYAWASLVAQLVKESACNAGDLGSIPGLGRSLGEGVGYPLQYSCLENSMDRGVRHGTVLQGLKKSDTTERLSLSVVF